MWNIFSLKNILFCLLSTVFWSCSNAQQGEDIEVSPGALQCDQYVDLLRDKAVACVVNQTSMLHNTHLVDTFVHLGINVHTIFAPEHGFRGRADAGQKVEDGVDARTGIPIVSLYGAHRRPSQKALEGVDIVVFDIQDVGVRFYTYISTLTYVMEACAQSGIPLIVLDRPNPNGHYVDGPVLEKEFSSFVGLHEIPVVYGMTMGEYANMVKGEEWIDQASRLELTVIPVDNYDHSRHYKLPIKPSPNLPNQRSILLYPSLCFFEGTDVSVGRGTPYPFQWIGHPNFSSEFSFVPKSREGAHSPPWEGQRCYGLDFTDRSIEELNEFSQLNLQPLLLFYQELKDSVLFFNPFFEKLAGTRKLREKIQEGWSAEEIRTSWKEELEIFMEKRSKYLLYPDF